MTNMHGPILDRAAAPAGFRKPVASGPPEPLDLDVVTLPGRGQPADAEWAAEWQAYVDRAPNASLYHALEWRDILLSTFGHRAWYLMARQAGTTRGVLPLIEMRSALFGHFLVSLPFLDYGGILADSPECEQTLANAAAKLAWERGVQHVELRQFFAKASPDDGEWRLRQHKAALVVPISPDPESHWAGLSSRLRGKVRKAQASGATFSVRGAESLDEFYRVFSLNMRNLGTPVYSAALFRNLLRAVPAATILMVRRGGRAVACAVALRRGGWAELPWICSDYTESRHYVSELLYWSAIEWASGSGVRELNLGRSSVGAGTYRFKLQWKPDVHPLFWYYWLAPGTRMPDLNADSPKFSFAVRCWTKLPLMLANRLGPPIVRNIP